MVRNLGIIFSQRVALFLAIERVDGGWLLLLALARCRHNVPNSL